MSTVRMQGHSVRNRNLFDHELLDTLNEVEYVQQCEFRNCGKSGKDKSPSWLEHYRKVMGYDSDTTFDCSAGGCERLGTHGGHVVFSDRDGCYLVPLCPKHNNPKRTSYYHCVAEHAVKLYEADYWRD